VAVTGQTSLTEGMPQGIVPMRAFSVQYLSVILIILTFTIGVFSGHRAQKIKHAKAAAQQAKVQANLDKNTTVSDPAAIAIGAMDLTNLFMPESSELNAETFEPLASVLTSHDLSARFAISLSRNPESIDAELGMALARSATLFRELVSRGVPAEALNVVTAEIEGDVPVSVTFKRDAEAK
jgi:hypothetical protein